VDDAGYGFDNIADVLSISPLLFEKYRAAAREVASEVTRLRPPPRVGVELVAEKVTVFAGTPERRDNLLVLNTPEDVVGTTIYIPARSVYRVLTRAAVTKSEQQPSARIEILCDEKPIAELVPTAEWNGKPGAQSTAFALIELPAGQCRIAMRLKSPAADVKDAAAAIGFLGISGPFTPLAPQASSYVQNFAGEQPLGTPILRLSGEDLDSGSGRSSLDTGRAWFSSNGYRHAPVLFSATGEYRVRFKVGAQQAGDEPVKFEVRVGEKTLGPFQVTAGSQVEQWVESTCELPAGQHDWQMWFINEFKDEQTGAERWFWLHEFTIEGPLDQAPRLTHDQAKALLTSAGRRLFRRPLTRDESGKLEVLLDSSLAAESSPLAAVGLVLEAQLVSPRFLYHSIHRATGPTEHGSALIDQLTLASRLSHFLWSSTPDEELLALAERGELRGNLRAQIKRMLDDPKSSALTTNFAGQWLQLRDLEQITPDQNLFPQFDGDLAADMRRETQLLFEHVLRENRSVVEFLDADYSFVNARLAEHYGLSAPADEGFHRVSLTESPRRGLLTHASVLTLTSHPTRTSPVKRGKWILEQMLGTEPPPAPRDVPPLPDPRENESLSLRARLEAHRANAACASCHALLDPLGFALENYDAIGRWRTTVLDKPIDASGKLITGEEFNDWSQLRASLVRNRREDFVRCLTEHLLTYALGRGVTYRDKLTVRAIVGSTEETGSGFQDLIVGICESVPFQRMRVDTP
jgi:hypothetical protein